jgi:hypothetical protein
MVGNSRVKYLTPAVLTLGVLSLFLFSACQQTPNVSGRFVSEKGVNIEAALPVDTFLLAKLGSRDAGQLSNLQTLNSYFPNDPLGSMVKEFNTGFKEGSKLEEAGLDYDKDILPILSPKTEVIAAIAPGEGNSMDKIKGILAMTLADEVKFDGLLNKQVEKKVFKKESYNNQEYYTQLNESAEKAYILRLKDTAFVFTDLQSMKTGLDNLGIDKVGLAGNQAYQRAMQNYIPSIAFIYGDFAKVTEFLKNTGSDGDALTKALGGSRFESNGADAVESETVVITVEKEGVRFLATVLGKSGGDLKKVGGAMEKSYLMHKINAKYPLIYSEAYGLRQAYDGFIKIAEKDAEMADGIKQMKEFLAAQDLDLEKDVLSFMDKGYAFVLEDTDSVFPALGIYLDAGSNAAGAAKVAGKIDKGLDEVWREMLVDSPQLSMLISKETVIPDQLWKYKLNLDPLLVDAPAEIAKKLSGQKVELYYGMLPENIFVIALKPDLEKTYGQSPIVFDGDEFKKALSYLKGADFGVTYLAPSQVFVYMDRVLKLVAEANGGHSMGDMTQYQQAKNYVNPIKSFVTASRGIEKEKLVVEAFLHIGQ